MKNFISYFARLKDFTSNMLPVSTAAFEQGWFRSKVEHIPELTPPTKIMVELEATNQMCRKECPFHAPCAFMDKYKEYLDSLDFDKVLTKLELLTLKHPNVDTIVLMVYEKYDVPCAERPCLQAWFKEHGIELKEWNKPQVKKTELF